MKTLITSATLAILTATTAVAQSQEVISLCRDVGETSYTIMELRQAGIPQSEMRSVFATGLDAGSPELTLALGLVIEAYAIPRFDVGQHQVRASEDFRDEQEAMCFRVKAGN